MMIRLMMMALCAVPVVGHAAAAAEIKVTMNAITAAGVGAAIGAISFRDTPAGLRISPDQSKLSPGPHGFHVHQNASCNTKQTAGKTVAGLAAGGHYDPAKSGKHQGPKGMGHLGDLPPLVVGSNGRANAATTAPRLKTSHLKGRAIMVHAGGDNFSDKPKRLGGGGARVACGVFK